MIQKIIAVMLVLALQVVVASGQDIRIFSAKNSNGAITPKTIQKAFESLGFIVDINNNMNNPFKTNKWPLHYTTYRLMQVHHIPTVAKLVEKYPEIGLLTPLSTSIWSDDTDKSINISMLTVRGISRITQIPQENKAINALADLMEQAVKKAMPKGAFKTVKYTKVADMDKQLATKFTAHFEAEEGKGLTEVIEDFEAEFEGEIESLGFLLPNYIAVKDELEEFDIDSFDYYSTYSICKLDVIHPVSKLHPEVGAFAPCTFFIYKKKGESTTHMGFPSVDNWLSATDIEDEASIKPLVHAQKLLENLLHEITE